MADANVVFLTGLPNVIVDVVTSFKPSFHDGTSPLLRR